MAKKKKKDQKPAGITGRYVYDKELGEIVKVSDEVPGVASKASSGPPLGPCGRPCDGGSCPSQ
ncbi:MAG: hypothetical protein ABIJ96_14820 [Elusimicrobiota bacterium]